MDEDGIYLVDGIVILEYFFRKVLVFFVFREGWLDVVMGFLWFEGFLVKYWDGFEFKIDI